MTNSKNISGVQCIANPYGLTWGKNSGKLVIYHQKGRTGQCHSFVRFNSDGKTISIAEYNEVHPLVWKNDNRNLGSDTAEIITSGKKYKRVGAYLNIKDVHGKHVGSILPGQVYDLYNRQIVNMPTPSDDPLVTLLHQHGLTGLNLVITDRPLEDMRADSKNYESPFLTLSSDIADKVFVMSSTAGQSEETYRKVVKFFMTEEVKENLTEDDLFKIKVTLQNFYREYKPVWLLVAEINLAEKLGPLVIKEEKVFALLKSAMSNLINKCHPLIKTKHHAENVAIFIRNGMMPSLLHGREKFAFQDGNMYGDFYGILREVFGANNTGDLPNMTPKWCLKQVSQDVYHVHMDSIEHAPATNPLFTISINDWNQMVKEIEEGLKNL